MLTLKTEVTAEWLEDNPLIGSTWSHRGVLTGDFLPCVPVIPGSLSQWGSWGSGYRTQSIRSNHHPQTHLSFPFQRLIDKTKVTYLKWLPESESLFLASHASGHLYLYNVSHPCASTPPQYSLLKQGEGFAVYAAKSKAPRNPLAKWAVGEGPLNEFAFSPDGRHLACVSQDGCLRVFHFDSMLLRGLMKSYFGGLLCVCWSPDGRYVVTGGEDDLVTVWSFTEGRVVARGHGHKSWVNAVAFDPYTTRAEEATSASGDGDPSGEEEEPEAANSDTGAPLSPLPKAGSITYRFGSAGQDTQFCLWDLTEDVLSPHPSLARTRTLPGTPGATPPASGSSRAGETGTGPLPRSLSRSNSLPHPAGGGKAGGPSAAMEPGTPFSIGRFATLTLQERRDRGTEKEHKRYHSLGNISRGGSGGNSSNDKLSGPAPRSRLDPAKVLGTALCPRIHEVPLLEPLVCKKIAQERLTVLLFLEDCIITACQEGLICTWARPGKAVSPPTLGRTLSSCSPLSHGPPGCQASVSREVRCRRQSGGAYSLM